MAPVATIIFQCNKNSSVSLTSNVIHNHCRGLLQFHQWVPEESSKMEVQCHQKCRVKYFFSSDTLPDNKILVFSEKLSKTISVHAYSD
jgi:hypothetical protein